MLPLSKVIEENLLSVRVNPIQAGGGEGAHCAPYRFFPAVPKQFIQFGTQVKKCLQFE